MPSTLFDTHAHLTYQQLQANLPEVLQHAIGEGVSRINCVATDLVSTRAAIALSQANPGVFATAGCHPNNCSTLTEVDWQAITELASHPNVVALGETGLDLYWKDSPFEIQLKWFQQHWRLAQQTGKPVVIHMRDCELEMLEALRVAHDRQGTLHGVMHSFSGNWSTAEQCLEMGLHISFAGMVTYKNAESLREVARHVPGDRLLVETDAPFLAPHPHRGQKPNLPGWVRHTAACLAEVRGSSAGELARLTMENANRLFGIAPNGAFLELADDARNSGANQT